MWNLNKQYLFKDLNKSMGINNTDTIFYSVI